MINMLKLFKNLYEAKVDNINAFEYQLAHFIKMYFLVGKFLQPN